MQKEAPLVTMDASETWICFSSRLVQVLVSTLTLVDLAGSNCSIHSSQKGGMFAKKNPSTMSSRSLSDLRTWVHTLVNKRPSSVKLPASNRIALT